MQVKNMKSPKGNAVPNQFMIIYGNCKYFQSYKVIIAKIENNNIFLDEEYYSYSRTTIKYRNIFLDMNTKEIENAIKRGSIKLTNLN